MGEALQRARKTSQISYRDMSRRRWMLPIGMNRSKSQKALLARGKQGFEESQCVGMHDAPPRTTLTAGLQGFAEPARASADAWANPGPGSAFRRFREHPTYRPCAAAAVSGAEAVLPGWVEAV